jgi:DNA polymerase I
MLINVDVSGLEVVVAADLSGDATLRQEVINKVNFHSDNQAKFNLPDRLTAKRFVFKLLYGATAYGYFMDSDFVNVGYSQKRWQEVIDAFYTKYKGIKQWHDTLLDTVKKQGHLEIPSGRCYSFEARQQRGEWKWPLTQIKNYPVQGFGADLVMLARIEFCKQFRESGLEGKFIQTIHDSLVVDTPSKNVNQIAKMLQDAIAKVPELCYTNWKYKFSLPLTSEVQVGMNKRNLEDYKTT